MSRKENRRQDHLFQLIQTLNSNERRYFKLYSNIQPGEKRYLRLFDALENKTEYSTEQLCQELTLSASQLADEKYYLTQVLLRSLRNFDDEAQVASSIYNALAEARALFNRGLYEYALIQTEKILAKVKRLEMYSIAIDVITLKQNCLRRLSKFGELRKLDDDNNLFKERYSELFEMTQLNYEVTELEQSRVNMAEANKLFDTPVFKKKPVGLRTFIVWFSLKCFEQMLTEGDPVKWVKFVNESVKHCSDNPHVLDINPLGYLYLYTDLVRAEIATKNYKEAIKVSDILLGLLEKPISSVPKGEIERATLFTQYLKAHALRRAKHYTEACKIAKLTYDNKHLRPVYDQVSFTFEYIINLMQCGLSAPAIDLINELLQTNTDARGDYQHILRILLIMAQIDIDNYSLVPYLIKSTRIWFKRKKIVNKEYDLFFKLAGNMAKAANNKTSEHIFDELLQAVKDGMLPKLDHELDFNGWVSVKR